MTKLSKEYYRNRWNNVDTKWAETMIGLRLSIPNHWWEGWTGNTLNPGRIEEYDADLARWKFKLDDVSYPEPIDLRWDAVVKYADETHPMFENYQLPAYPVTPLELEMATTKKTYKKTAEEDWERLHNFPGNPVEPIEYTGESEEFSVNMTDAEKASMKDAAGNV